MGLIDPVEEPLRQMLDARAVAGVAALTVLLTCAFVGLFAFVRGGTAGVESRLAYYVLATALVFVVAVFQLDRRDRRGTDVLRSVIAVAIAAFVLVLFAAEGIVYAVSNPEQVFSSQLVVYFAAAALICTGVGVWGLHHWREFAVAETRE